VKHNNAANADIDRIFLVISFVLPALGQNMIVFGAMRFPNLLIPNELHMNVARDRRCVHCGAVQA
jgi:hypothetical protein